MLNAYQTAEADPPSLKSYGAAGRGVALRFPEKAVQA